MLYLLSWLRPAYAYEQILLLQIIIISLLLLLLLLWYRLLDPEAHEW